MSKAIKLKRGLDIRLTGEAGKRLVALPPADSYGISPLDFEGVVPKLLVKPGNPVKAGTPLFFDKYHPEVLFTSPVSGKVESVSRGDKRKVLFVSVESDGKMDSEKFDVKPLEKSSKEEVKELLLKSGLWPLLTRRPYGIIANTADEPKAIFVSGFDSAPLAPDMDFALKGQEENLKAGFAALGKLTSGKVHLGVKAGSEGLLSKMHGVEKTAFSGPHPAGNVGVQIHHVAPINKGEVVWTVDIQSVAIIGRLMLTGKLDQTRVYALTGSELVEPVYVSAVTGAPFVSLLRGNIKRQGRGERVRIINGNVLSGKKADPRGYVAFNTNHVTVIPEGDKYELLGWAMPRLDKFSVSRSYFSWICPKKKYTLDTNLHGGHRPYIVTGLFERYLPMDIYPMYLFKAILAKDIDKMENLGIYEIVEEDVALCEFVDPSKNDIQQTVRDGINLMIKELS
jgi:Na+-transporting NADH:ubiquinone oxidoreductase subunit A